MRRLPAVSVAALALCACATLEPASPGPAAAAAAAARLADERHDEALRLVADAATAVDEERYDDALRLFNRSIELDPSLDGLKPGESRRRLAPLLTALGLPGRTLRGLEIRKEKGEAGEAAYNAIQAFLDGRDTEAMLWASAAAGVDPGRETFRLLLQTVSGQTGLPVAPEEVVPRAALVELKLRRAETAFLEDRFGEAARACGEALLLAPKNPTAWVRLGSAQFAVGEKDKARKSYERALALDPDNPSLRRFLASKGWLREAQ